MPVLTVKLPGKDRQIKFSVGRSVREILDETDIRVRAGCNGIGACGLCHIKIISGDAGQPTANELTSLGAAQVGMTVRLACQVKAESDLQIEIISPAPPSMWHQLENSSAAICTGFRKRETDIILPLSVAIDLGTTHISMSVVDLVSGRRVTGRRSMNPQTDLGADVVTRLMAARSGSHAALLSHKVITAIGDGLQDICSREGIDLGQVGSVAIVGNTAMLALLSGQNYLNLLQPRYWTESIECAPVETASWARTWGIKAGANIELIPPLAGFVGSDLLAGITSTRLIDQQAGAVLIDFGTNSEMCLWDGNKLWVTSAAGGPAFEGCGISCGMPADPGAIFRVVLSDKSGEFVYETIAGAEPQGLCGSGLVDLLAHLIKDGSLNEKGLFAPGVPDCGFTILNDKGRKIVLTKKDVDIFQRAKAAIGVALEVLLAKAGMGYHELKRVYISGAFGQYLDITGAQQIGLLPSDEMDFVTTGNTALFGCESYLLCSDSEEYMNKTRRVSNIINLSEYDDFEMLFLDHLYLRQIAGVRK